ncbi:hypothetical protein FGX01_01495, partial [Xylella fastidiosa subsp. multiplex]|nr:hypothetical protein [Xylella fastidiosa subsp. multiplex]
MREARSREHALLKARLGELADAHAEVAQALASCTDHCAQTSASASSRARGPSASCSAARASTVAWLRG